MFTLSPTTIQETNRLKKNKAGKEIAKIDDALFSKIFNLNNINKPELININNKYYLSEIAKVEKINRTLDDIEIKKAIISQLKIKHIIDSNANIVKEMAEGNFKKQQFNNFGEEKKIEIKNIILRDVKDESIFISGIIKEIFKMKDGELQLVTDSMLTKNYIIYVEKTEKLLFNKNSKNYEQYKSKAKLNLANQIYSTFDKTINNRYKVEINQKVLSRIKNTL